MNEKNKINKRNIGANFFNGLSLACLKNETVGQFFKIAQIVCE
jgi:hypothetical protein